MAIRLKVHTSTLKLKTAGGDASSFTMHEGIPIYPNQYTGAYEVTPTEEEQTLDTAGYMMTENVTVAPIPTNYGKITQHGSTIIVS